MPLVSIINLAYNCKNSIQDTLIVLFPKHLKILNGLLLMIVLQMALLSIQCIY